MGGVLPLRGNPLKNKSFTKIYYLKLQLLVELTVFSTKAPLYIQFRYIFTLVILRSLFVHCSSFLRLLFVLCSFFVRLLFVFCSSFIRPLFVFCSSFLRLLFICPCGSHRLLFVNCLSACRATTSHCH